MLSLVKTAEITSFIMITAIVAIFVFQLIVPAISKPTLPDPLPCKGGTSPKRLQEFYSTVKQLREGGEEPKFLFERST